MIRIGFSFSKTLTTLKHNQASVLVCVISVESALLIHLFYLQYSICKEPLIELSNPGASSSWFYLTSDDEFIIKTVQHKEAEFLQKLLPGYYMVSHTIHNNIYKNTGRHSTIHNMSLATALLFFYLKDVGNIYVRYK